MKKPVNPPYTIPDWVGQYESLNYESFAPDPTTDDHVGAFFESLRTLRTTTNKTGYPSVPAREVSKKYPIYIPGIDNEETYAQGQGIGEKWVNGFAKMGGIALDTFLRGTIGLVYGLGKTIQTGKFSSFYDNELTRSLDEWTEQNEERFVNYQTQRQREANWWEPASLFTANFWTDNVIRNLGFAIGTIGSGFAWNLALKGIGLTGRLTSLGAKWASQADDILSKSVDLAKSDRLGNAVSGLNSAWNTAKSTVGRALTKPDRFIVSSFGTVGEAGIEAMHNSKLFREALIEDFKLRNGYLPNAEEIKQIDYLAEKVGNGTFAFNTALLTVTNYAMLPKIFSSTFRGDKVILNGIMREGGKYVETLPAKGFGRTIRKTVGTLGTFFSGIEAFEEGAQYAIQTGVSNYYKRKYDGYNNPSIIDDGVLFGMKEALTSDEGLLNIFVGGISGAIMTAPSRLPQKGITGYGGAEGRFRKEAIDALNKTGLRDKLKEAYTNIKAAEIAQEERMSALNRGDILESKDAEFDYAHLFLETRLKYNAKSLVDLEIEELKQEASTDEGFAKLKQEGVAAPTDTKESFIRRLDNLQEHANYASQLYDSFKIKFGTPSKDKKTDTIKQRLIDGITYIGAKIWNYENRINQLSSELAEIPNLEEIMKTGKGIEEAIEKVSPVKKDDYRQKLQDLVEINSLRSQFAKDYERLYNLLKNFDEISKDEKSLKNEIKNLGAEQIEYEEAPEPKEEVKPSRKIKTKYGEIDFETGVEYFVSNPYDYDSRGNRVRKPFTKITIVGENEDGTLRVKDENGNEILIKEKDLKRYGLSKTSITNDNKKANFFLKNADNIFEYNFGGGKKRIGHLEYDPNEDALYFVYVEDNGKVKRRELLGKDFVAQRGYTTPKITIVGQYSEEQQKSFEDFKSYRDKRESQVHNVLLNEIKAFYSETVQKAKDLDRLIKEKRDKIDEIKENIKNLRKEENKKVNGKKVASKLLSDINSLRVTLNTLKKELKELESQKVDADSLLDYLNETISYISQNPLSVENFQRELEDQIENISKRKTEIDKQIKQTKGLIKTLNKAIKNAIDLVIDLLKKANVLPEDPNFLREPEKYKEDIKKAKELLTTIDDVEVNANIDKLEELNASLLALKEEFDGLAKDEKLGKQLLDRLTSFINKEEARKKQSAALKGFSKKVQSTYTSENPIVTGEKDFDPVPKKSDYNVVNGTIGIDDGKPHQKRANTFGINYRRFPPELKKRIKGIEITEKTEGLAGIPGLIKYLLQGTNIPSDTVIAVIVVLDNGDGTFSFIDENGNVIKDDLINKAIYQVRPTEKLMMNYGRGPETMFRSTTPIETQERLRKAYAEHRKKVLESTTLQPMRNLSVSFGVPVLDYNLDENGKKVKNFSAQNPVTEIGLVTEEEIIENKVSLEVSTTKDPTPENGVTFTNALGRIFLRIPGVGLIKLNTGKIGINRAEVIYQIINRIANNIIEGREEESRYLFEYLRAIVYWGIQRDPDTNERKPATEKSIWFENVGGEEYLFIGKSGTKFKFDPLSLEENKGAIIQEIANLYHNVSNSELKKNRPFIEIKGFDEKGQPITVRWESYQHYLLSSKGRKGEEIPLTTPIATKDKVKDNFEGIYFVLHDAVEVIETPKQDNVEQFKTPSGNTILYKVDKDGKVVLVEGADLEKSLAAIAKAIRDKNPGVSDENLIIAHARKQLIEYIESNRPKPEEKKETKKNVIVFRPKNQARPVPPNDEEAMRLVIKNTNGIIEENWPEVEEWLRENFPNIPVYRVKQAIYAANGRQAWGMLHRGAIYLAYNAESGTIYHEVFEAVWKMFTPPNERQKILDEFRNREGTFKNRFTGVVKPYAAATDHEIKEELAEEFREYVLYKKLPGKPTYGRSLIAKLFIELWNFIKEFFTGEKAQTNTANLFKKIDSGHYRNYNAFEESLSFAKQGIIDIESVVPDENAEYRLKIPYRYKHDLMQHMTYRTLTRILKNDENLFRFAEINKSDLYNWLKDDILSLESGILQQKYTVLEKMLEEGSITNEFFDNEVYNLDQLYREIESNWEKIVEEHVSYLNQYNITFDEDEALVVEEERDKGYDGLKDVRKIDQFRKTSAAIKLMLSTLPISELVDDRIIPKRNSVNGISVLPLGKVYSELKAVLHNSYSIDDMLQKLKSLGKVDLHYRLLYSRLTKSPYTEDDRIDLSKVTEKHHIDVLSAFYKTMRSSNPDVKVIYMLYNGEVEVIDGNLSNAIRITKNDFFSYVQNALRRKNNYLEYKNGSYRATDKIKSLKPKGKEYLSFLESIGIYTTNKEYNQIVERGLLSQFEENVQGIIKSISAINEAKDINKYTLDIDGRLLNLAIIKNTISPQEPNNAYININGDITQSYLGNNLITNFVDLLEKISNSKELVGTPYEYLLTDTFAKGSLLMSEIFSPKTGSKRKWTPKVGMVDGIIDESYGRNIDATRTTKKERLIMELNLNSQGWFMNLVPGDSSIEWIVKLFPNPKVTANALSIAYNDDTIFGYFKGYFTSEIEVYRENRKLAENKENSLRFFKAILRPELHDKIISEENLSPEEIYDKYKDQINRDIENFIKAKAENTYQKLVQYDIVNEGGVSSLSFVEENASKETIMKELEAIEANYIINNIELHKVFYSDPYFYKDELKRIKNFNSPAQSLANSEVFNKALDTVYNKGFKKNKPGYTDFTRPYLVSAVMEDVRSFSSLPGYDEWVETDSAGFITLKAKRNVFIRAGLWTENDEKQYQFDMMFEDLVKKGATKKELDEFLKNNPRISSTYTPIKPVVRGSKIEGNNFNDITLDKFALFVISYRLLYEINRNSNALKHYQRMVNSGVDYVVFESARKVGKDIVNEVYDENGKYVTTPLTGTSKIPFDIFYIQTEVPTDDTLKVRRGSQSTKLVVSDFLDAGVPIDFMPNKGFSERLRIWNSYSEQQKREASELYDLIRENDTILSELIEHGYQTLLTDMGIVEKDGNYVIEDRNALYKTLSREVFRLEVNENIVRSMLEFKKGDVILEATPLYNKIRNIIYSVVRKRIVEQKISGGGKVQMPSTLLESERVQVDSRGRYSSDILKFYEDSDGNRVMEIMVSRWFNTNMSDEELLDYLNNTPEGQNILSSFAFRIPTQGKNFIDSIRIKKFLPKEFQDNVVIPSALVKKEGSDFDVDKLYTYLKNVFVDVDGNPRLIPFVGYGQQAKEKIEQMIEDGLIIPKDILKEVKRFFKRSFEEDYEWSTEKLFEAIFPQVTFKETYIIEAIENSKNYHKFKDKIINEIYRQSLENAYIDSLIKLNSHEKNFENLIKPNDPSRLKDLAAKIARKKGITTIDNADLGNIIDREFMSNLRYNFVVGKRQVGLGASSITKHAQFQRAPIVVSFSNLKNLPNEFHRNLMSRGILIKQINRYDGDPILSMIKNVNGEYISDILKMVMDGFVDITKGTWIIDLGLDAKIAPAWIAMIRAGIDVEYATYLINQPIVQHYMDLLDSKGYRSLISSSVYEDIVESYGMIAADEAPSKKKLFDLIGKENLTVADKAIQVFALNEVLKFAIIANELYNVNASTDYDTTSFNDPLLLFKKEILFENVNKGIITPVDQLFERSFIGKIRERLNDAREAVSRVIISDQGSVREVLSNVLMPYIYLPDSEFLNVARTAVMNLFDWAVQTNSDFSSLLERLLLAGKDRKTAATEIIEFINVIKNDPNHPLYNNHVINSLRQYSDSVIEGKPHNIYISNKENKVYDQNSIINGFGEIKEYLESVGNLDLYKKLVNLAILQSGLNNSRFSFTHLLPYEDFREFYNEGLMALSKLHNLMDFHNLGVFQRVNWHNDSIVPHLRGKWLKLKNPYEDIFTGATVNFIKNKEIRFLPNSLKNAVEKGIIPRVIQVSTFEEAAGYDYIFYTWESDISKEKKAEMRKKGDYSYINRGLFRKVYISEGKPYVTTYKNKRGNVYTSYVYRLVNAWGDSFKANEYYSYPKESVINNNTLKTKEVTEDGVLIDWDSKILSIVGIKTEVKDIETPVETEAVKIYKQLPEKTESGNVVIKSVYRQEGVEYAKSIGGIFSLRTSGKFHFGNLFTSNPNLAISQDLIYSPSTRDAVIDYIEWILDYPGTFEEITNHSGGAVGADSKFDEIGRKYGQNDHMHYYYNQKTPNGNVKISEEEYREGVEMVNKVAPFLGKSPSNDSTLGLLARNWIQVKNSTQIVAIAPISPDMVRVEGGTGWAVAMAQQDKSTKRMINVFNLKDNKWYIWDGNKFVRSGTPVLQRNFAGIGSRNITKEGIAAIESVYKKTQREMDRLNWIRSLIGSGSLVGKPIVYYKELNEPSHATALDYLINSYNTSEGTDMVPKCI